ncbi:MAG: hypothetical protein P8L77_06290 [Gammaproteobacteria bacterium]|nr:hypothetical protein [Gammaproteobacteria bacterium]
MKNIFKLILVSIVIFKPVFAFQDNFMIDNQSSCILKINPKIGNKFVHSAPAEIKAHSQTPIQYKFNDGIGNITLLAYDILCDERESGQIGVITEMFRGTLDVAQYTVTTNRNIYADIDSNGNFILKNI